MYMCILSKSQVAASYLLLKCRMVTCLCMYACMYACMYRCIPMHVYV